MPKLTQYFHHTLEFGDSVISFIQINADAGIYATYY